MVLSGPPVRDTGAGEALTVTATPLAGGRELAVTVAGRPWRCRSPGKGRDRSRAGLRGGPGPPRRPGHPHPRRREQRRGGGRGRRDRVHEDALEIRAPASGTLADIGAKAGDAVAAGALLLRVELREDTGRESE